MRHPSPWEVEAPEPEARALLAQHRKLAETRLLEMLTKAGVDTAALTAPPRPSTASSFGYCPRCHAEYLERTAGCADCQVEVAPFGGRG